jgi:C-terminal processing protease CtpA/Prc
MVINLFVFTFKPKLNNMITKVRFLGLLMFFSVLVSCHDDIDDVIRPASAVEINDFIWKAMNIFYLYKSDVPDLADDRFDNNEQYRNYLNSFESPEAIFEALQREGDEFSFIVSDFRTLEQNLDGITLDSGMRFGLVQFLSSGDVFGYVRYVIDNSPADQEGIERGMIFNRIDGEVFTENTDFKALLSQESFSLGLATLNGNQVESIDVSVNLNQTEITENPIHRTNVIDLGNQKVGYLMYNSFIDNNVNELNDVFGDFAAQNITDLVLDLRYNSGGAVVTSEDLASMITGQFSGELYATQEYNGNFDDEQILFNNSTSRNASINSLNLNEVYVITSPSTASASELLISALNPYINVVQVGTNTVGKFQGSITLYDSEDFTRQNVNPNHRYAIQPLVLRTVNSVGFTDFTEGLAPDVNQSENYANLGQLGETDEPLLNTVLNMIGNGRPAPGETFRNDDYKIIGESKMNLPNYQRMYINEKLISPQMP